MTPLGQLVEANRQFEEAHGGKPVRDPDSGFDLFPDGTTRRYTDVLNAYEIREPVTPAEQLRGRRRYVELLLKLEERAFHGFKQSCLPSRFVGELVAIEPSPPANAVEQLEAGTKRIHNLQQQLAQLDREISQLPDELARAAYEEQCKWRTANNRLHENKIRSITY